MKISCLVLNEWTTSIKYYKRLSNLSKRWNRSCFSSSGLSKDFVKTLPMIYGHATTAGTLQYMKSCSWKLYHHFQRSNLYIYPIIHGPPKDEEEYPSNLEITDEAFSKALLVNQSNCLYIYDYRPNKSWYTTVFNRILTDPNNEMISRENVVSIAGLGVISDPDAIVDRLNEATRLTRIGNIDIPIVEFSESLIESNINSMFVCLKKLESLAQSKQILTYGVKINLSPYRYHTPPYRKSSRAMLAQTMIEDELYTKYPNAELIVYTISPSHAIPATYPMLPNPKIYTDEESTDREINRTYSRASFDPFTCLPGLGNNSSSFTEDNNKDDGNTIGLKESSREIESGGVIDNALILISGIIPNKVEKTINSALDKLCPQLVTTPEIHNKVLRVVFSVGIDVVIVDSLFSAYLDPLTLTSDDLIESSATDNIFGEFHIPKHQSSND